MKPLESSTLLQTMLRRNTNSRGFELSLIAKTKDERGGEEKAMRLSILYTAAAYKRGDNPVESGDYFLSK